MPGTDEVTCRLCGGRDGTVVLDLGLQPPCESFRAPDSPGGVEPFALRMWLCEHCRLAQLAEDPGHPESDLFSVEPAAMREQAIATLDYVAEQGVLRAGRRVLEFGSPHGSSWLPELVRRGARPVDRVGRGDADIVVDVFGLLHESDQERALRARASSLAPGGSLVVQMHSVATVLAHQEVGELRHGHFAYWSAPALAAAVTTLGLGIHRARLFPYDRGTVVLIVTRNPDPDQETLDLLASEERCGVTDTAALSTLQIGADRRASELSAWLDREIGSGRRVALYGAASRAVPLLVHANVDDDRITAVADASSAKQGRLFPGTGIPIVAPDALASLQPDRVVLMLADLLDEVRSGLPFVEEHGGRWVVLGDGTPRLVPPAASVAPVP